MESSSALKEGTISRAVQAQCSLGAAIPPTLVPQTARRRISTLSPIAQVYMEVSRMLIVDWVPISTVLDLTKRHSSADVRAIPYSALRPIAL